MDCRSNLLSDYVFRDIDSAKNGTLSVDHANHCIHHQRFKQVEPLCYVLESLVTWNLTLIEV
jgi:hypothetical protein